MKKLSLKAGGIKEMLTKDQMKKVVGGDLGSGSVDCVHDWWYWYCTECTDEYSGGCPPGWSCHTVDCTSRDTGTHYGPGDGGSNCCPPGTY